MWCCASTVVILLGLGFLCMFPLLSLLVLGLLFLLGGKLGKSVCWLHPLVLAVSDVSPFEVDVALGMNAQQWEACVWLLQCLQETLQSLQ